MWRRVRKIKDESKEDIMKSKSIRLKSKMMKEEIKREEECII